MSRRLHIEVALEFQVYNHSVNEAGSRLSPAALGLVSRRDLLGFFDACGMYYVRSINRLGSYVSVLSYENPTGERDPAFEADVEAMIKGWARSKKGVTSEPPPVPKMVARQATSNRLTIQSVSVGFGKRPGAGSFIAQDLESFRAAILTAFQAIQSEDIGLVGSVEIAPWVENAQFQASLALSATDIVVAESGTARAVTISPHQQRRILVNNAEFLAELGGATHTRLELYEDARKCREDIEREYRELEDDGVTWRWSKRGEGSAAEARVQNQRTKEWDRTLQDVWEIVNPNQTKRLQEDYQTFVYGLPPGTTTASPYAGNGPEAIPFAGANACTTELLADQTLLTRPHREVPACQRLEEFFTVARHALITDYCRPKVE